jgi:hypothetical protein
VNVTKTGKWMARKRRKKKRGCKKKSFKEKSVLGRIDP